MFRHFILIIVVFGMVSFAKEITTSELKPNTILIKVTNTQTLKKASQFVKEFDMKYDLLTLKDINYIL